MNLVKKIEKSNLPKSHMISIRVSEDLKKRWHKYCKENQIEQTQTFKAILEAIMNGDIK